MEQEFKVIPIDTETLRPWLLEIHYLKRVTSTSYRFGLIKGGEILGVVSYGNALPLSVVNSPFGENWASCVQELNRLVLSQKAPANSASFLVAQSIKQLPKPTIIVSYADAGKGHVGYIYQASNFLYTGKSHTQKDWRLKSDPDRHSRTLMDEFAFEENRIEKLKNKYGDDLIQVQRPPKYRYIFIHGTQKQKKRIMKDAKFKTYPYPKGESKKLCDNKQINSQLFMF